MSSAAGYAPTRPGLGRGVKVALALLLVTLGGGVTSGPARAATAPQVPAAQAAVILLHDHAVRSWPSLRAQRTGSVPSRTPLTRVRTVLPVLRKATSSDGLRWVRVRLPGRPNGRTGWIRAAATRTTSIGWHISLRLSTREVVVHRDGRVVRRMRAVIGAPSTPTPRGRFFIEEALALDPGTAGGPYALATSARSEVLQEFQGGPGQIALHGTAGLGDPVGTAASHGCIRLSTADITWLARRIGGGVPLTVRR